MENIFSLMWPSNVEPTKVMLPSETINDLSIPYVCEQLNDLLEKLRTLKEYQYHKLTGETVSSIWDLLSRLKELEVYVECVESIKNCLQAEKLMSAGLQCLVQNMCTIYNNSGFEYLKRDIEHLSAEVGC